MKNQKGIYWATRLAIAFAAMVVFSPGISLLRGQGTAYIAGYILDPTEAAIPNAEVVIKNEGTGIGFTLKSNEAGLYRSPPLTPGSYEISVTAPGFQKLVQRGAADSLIPLN